MSCPYSDDELQKWDSVANPMGEPCYHCDEVECEHYAGDEGLEYDDVGYPDYLEESKPTKVELNKGGEK